MTQLARVLDPAAHDALTGTHGKMSVELSEGDRGEAVTLILPRRVVCARCDGGGCDSCGRSGAIRLDDDDAARTTHFVVPSGGDARFRVRLVRPLGDDAGLEQLTVEVRLRPGPARSGEENHSETRAALLALAMLLAAALAAVFRR